MPPWFLVELPSYRSSEKPALLIIAQVREVTGGAFQVAPRVYNIVNDTSDWEVRGGHVHPEGGKQEFLVCLAGSARIQLHSRGHCSEVVLERPDQALFIPTGVWHEVHLSPGAVLQSVASTEFHPEESSVLMPCTCRK